MKWRLASFPWNNSADKREIRQARGVMMTLRLRAPHSLTFSMNAIDEHASFIEELITDVVVSLDAVDVARFRTGPVVDTGGESSIGTNFQFADYREVLKRRALKAADTLSYTGVDQSVIALGLINSVESRANGDYGITAGVGAATGVVRTRNFVQGQFIGKEIEDMSNVINGFDWEIAPDMKLNIYYPSRGANNGVNIEYGRSISGFTRSRNPSSFANDDIVTGGMGTTPVEIASGSVTTDAMGRWDGVFSYPDIENQSTLDARSSFLIAQSSSIIPTYNVQLSSGFWKGPSHIGLGDIVRLRVVKGRINDDILMRVLEISVAIGDDGGETVRLGLGV